ncbi:MAG: preprotein translocase subunit SecD, partial [Anaerolineales bacterium]
MTKNTRRLLIIIPLAILALLIAIYQNPINIRQKSIYTHLGLDLVGGVQVLLEADLPDSADISSDVMNTVQIIISNRANGMLGVGEAIVQQVGNRRISVELPGETDPAAAIAVLGETGQLEFVDMSVLTPQQAAALVGTTIVTDYPVEPPDLEPDTTVYHTVMNGSSLKNVSVVTSLGENVIAFSLDEDGAKKFRDYTTDNVGNALAIVLDKEVISVPVV